METEFRATTPADHPRVADLLARVFHLAPDHPMRNESLQHWKYWQPHPWWDGSRSYVLERDGVLAAHGSIWPMRLRAGDRDWRGIFLTDWAAAPAEPAGVGIALLRRIAALTEVVCAIGGTEMTQAIMPKIGFRPFNEMWFGVRPLRPFLQARTHPFRNWKLPARWLRNTAWSLWPPAPVPPGWSTVACAPRDIPDSLWPGPGPDLTVGGRDARLLEYYQESPWAASVFRGAVRNGELAGYFCLTFPAGQARVADLWTPSRSPEDWRALYALALAEARRNPEAVEITAVHSTPWGQQALLGAGFRIPEKHPILFCGANDFLAGRNSIHMQMIDADFGFVRGSRPEYWL